MQYFKDVHAFHEKFDVPRHRSPRWPEEDLIQFRIKFLTEELNEIIDSVHDDDLEGVLDGLVDLVYVALGTALTFGLDFHAAWERVQQANMEKIAVRNTEQGGRHSTDVVKPEGWKPPRFKDLINEAYVRSPMNGEEHDG